MEQPIDEIKKEIELFLAQLKKTQESSKLVLLALQKLCSK